MSMEHKAFLFDTQIFHSEIEPVMRESIKNPEAARQYICEHYDQLQSPYTGDVLEEDWEEEFDDLTLQVYFDILLTACYDVEDEMGLGEMWDTVNEFIEELDVFEEPQIAVLGREIVINGVKVDPGMMGLGLVEIHEIQSIYNTLLENREDDTTELDERTEAYDNLCSVYEEAIQQDKGILFTF